MKAPNMGKVGDSGSGGGAARCKMQSKIWVLKKTLRGRLRTSSEVRIIQAAKQGSPGKRLVKHLSLEKDFPPCSVLLIDDRMMILAKLDMGVLCCFAFWKIPGVQWYKHWKKTGHYIIALKTVPNCMRLCTECEWNFRAHLHTLHDHNNAHNCAWDFLLWYSEL